LKSHEESEKPGEEYRIYNVEMVWEWIRTAESDESIRTAQDLALDLVRERAKELGRDEWLVDPWGCLKRRERRAVKKIKNNEIPRP
jgi:hypothetical protein